MKDFPRLIRILDSVRHKWEEIAVQLKVSDSEIAAIKACNSQNLLKCLSEALKLWLKSVDPLPTNRQLVDALSFPPVKEVDVAKEILPHFQDNTQNDIVCAEPPYVRKRTVVAKSTVSVLKSEIVRTTVSLPSRKTVAEGTLDSPRVRGIDAVLFC